MKNLFNEVLLRVVISFKLNPIVSTIGVAMTGVFGYEVLKMFIG